MVVTPNTSSASLRSYVYFSWLSFQTSLKLPQKKQPPFGAGLILVLAVLNGFFAHFFRIGFAHLRVVTPNTSSASLRSYVYFSWLSVQTSLKLHQQKQPPFGAGLILGLAVLNGFSAHFFRIGFAHPMVVTPNTSSASLRSYVYFSWLSVQTSLKLHQQKQPPFGAAAVFVVEKGFEPP
ncbi:MAG: hypothetical protein ACJ0QJ_05435 [Flavobacteriales bacterium]